MCGIAGLWNPDRPPERDTLLAMLAPLHHRGPDGTGTHLDGPVGLAHARLAIIDLTGGAQPLANENSSVWVSFNGEIFNYMELREELLAHLPTRPDLQAVDGDFRHLFSSWFNRGFLVLRRMSLVGDAVSHVALPGIVAFDHVDLFEDLPPNPEDPLGFTDAKKYKDRLKATYKNTGLRDAFAADPESDKPPFCIVIPPPNVTGSLHMGHALNNTLQDILCRFERMRGKDVLWQPGTDHAGIATQMVVERQMEARQDKRTNYTREAFVEKVWEWKAESGGTITNSAGPFSLRGYRASEVVTLIANPILYEHGVLKWAATRGNGLEGEDVTFNVLGVPGLPGRVEGAPEVLEVRGELYLSRAEFARMNDERAAAGEPPFKNPRNAASGTIRQLDPRVSAGRRKSGSSVPRRTPSPAATVSRPRTTASSPRSSSFSAASTADRIV